MKIEADLKFNTGIPDLNGTMFSPECVDEINEQLKDMPVYLGIENPAPVGLIENTEKKDTSTIALNISLENAQAEMSLKRMYDFNPKYKPEINCSLIIRKFDREGEIKLIKDCRIISLNLFPNNPTNS